MRRESPLKSALMKVLHSELPSYVHLRHEDVRSAGHPDISSTGDNMTTWIEVKHGTPKFDSMGIQELTMLRLARSGHARYLIYIEDALGNAKRTLIVHPRDLKSLTPEAFAVGHDHRFVADWLRKAHA